MAKANRVGSIDFWRGGVLVAILVDHVPGNLLEFLTPRNFGLSDSAEAFVYLSGLSVGMVYLPRACKHGLGAVARGCFERALKLYGVHIAMTAAALIIFASAFWLSGVDELIEGHGRSLVFGSPATALPAMALLTHQLGYFNILPLYIALMLWAPLAVSIAMRNYISALVISVGIYAASRGFGLHLPTWPQSGGWFFNPFAWQLVFTIGLVSAVVWRNGPPRASRRLVAASAATVALAALITTSAVGLAPGLRDAASAHLDLAKQDLGLARLVHFAALAYLVAIVPGLGRLVEGRLGRAVQSLGRNSLTIFAAGSLVAALGQAALAVAAPHTSARVVSLAGLTYTLTGIVALFGFARWIECRKTSAAPVPGAHLSSAAAQPL
jgi:hypothetical protein